MAIRTALFMLALGIVASVSAASAQTYPDRPVKIIVPIGPSGSYDIVGRLLADQLTRRLGQTFVVENRPGAGTIVGTQFVVTAPPDGYTLLVGGLSNIAFNAGLYRKLAYDPLQDLVPVALVFNISYTLVGSTQLPYSTPKEIIEAARKNPGGLKLANAGTGTGQHIVGAAFMSFTGTKFLEVPYRGSALAFPDLLSGRVDLFFELDARCPALRQVRPGQGDRHPDRQAQSANPGCPDHDRGWRAQSGDRFMDWSVRPGENATSDDRTSAGGNRPVASRAQTEIRIERRRTHGNECGSPRTIRKS